MTFLILWAGVWVMTDEMRDNGQGLSLLMLGIIIWCLPIFGVAWLTKWLYGKMF